MRSRILLPFPIKDDWQARTRIQVFWDDGTGTVDFTAPLLPRPHILYPNDPVNADVFDRPDFFGPDLFTGDPVREGGLLQVPSIFDEVDFFAEEAYVWVQVLVPAAHRLVKFVARATDDFGNVQTEADVEVQVLQTSTTPRDVIQLTVGAFDAVNDNLAFTYTLTTE